MDSRLRGNDPGGDPAGVVRTIIRAFPGNDGIGEPRQPARTRTHLMNEATDLHDPATARVVFMPSGRRGEFPTGTPVLAAARSLGVDIDSVCGGRAICGRCQVSLSTGEFAKLGIESREAHLGEATTAEQKYDRIKGLAEGRRLSCQAVMRGDIVIDVPAESQIHRQMVRKAADEIRDLEIDPVVKLFYVELDRPSMVDQTCDLTRLLEALEREWELAGLSADLSFLQRLSAAMRAGETYGGDWKGTVAVHEGRDLVAVWPGFKEHVYGLAVDVGTTTIAGHLCNLESGEVVASSGMMNPQIRFGEDLMSRISYLQQNEGQAPALTAAVQGAIRELAGAVATEAGIEREDIVEASLVGNPTMHHLVLGIDPTQLGMEPFPLVVDRGVTVKARDLGMDLNPGACAYFLPCIAGHVGADTAGVVLSQGPHLGDDMTLVIDVGTNAEIVLGSGNRLIAASSPTGPAFEGAQIAYGQRAAPGAIERVRIDRDTLMPRVKVIGSELWSDEDGFEEAIESIGVTGICGSGIIEAVGELHLAGIVSASGRMQARGRRRRGPPQLHTEGPQFRVHAVPQRGSGGAGRAIRHPGNPAREIRVLLGREAAHGRDGGRPGGPHLPRRRIRQLHRRQVRDGDRDDPGLPARERELGRQCGRDRRADRAPEPGRAQGNRDRDTTGGEGGDRH